METMIGMLTFGTSRDIFMVPSMEERSVFCTGVILSFRFSGGPGPGRYELL